LFGDLRKKVGAAEPEPPTPPPVSGKKDSPEPPSSPEPAPEGAAAQPAPSPEPEKGKGKTNPWKLVDEHKAARLRAETELAELRKTMLAPEKAKELTDKAAKLEADWKAAQEELRFTNYAKSEEFKEKYQKPYEESWQKWMAELGELTVQGADGQDRPIQPQDLLELVNMPLVKARELADSTFGAFADDVMSARKEIRGLFDAQNKALEQARKDGETRDTTRQQQFQQAQQQLASTVKTLWDKSNELVVADEKVGKYFKEIEGDAELNARLKKGYEIADQAFDVNTMDPRLTPDQRQAGVQLHAAVRQRAAAFGRLVYQLEKADGIIAELKAELGKYKEATPGAGEHPHQPAPEGAGSARDQVFAALRARAH